MGERQRPSAMRLNNKRRVLVIGGLVVLLGGSAGAWAATRPTPPAYRLAAAAPSDVTRSLASTGTVEAVSQATVGFPVSGQVASVNVHIGQVVRAGDTLAQLNTTALDSQLSSAQSKVATSQAKLAADQSSQNAAAGGSAPSGGSSARPSGGSGSSAGSAKSGSALRGLSGAQSAVLATQHQVDGDLTLVAAAIKQENTTCRPVIAALNNGQPGGGNGSGASGSGSGGSGSGGTGSPGSGGSGSTKPPGSRTPSPASSGSPSSSPSSPATGPTTAPQSAGHGGNGGTNGSGSGNSGSGGPGTGQAAKCSELLQQVLDDQSKAAADEKRLADAENSLTKALSQAIAGANQSSGGATGSSARTSGSATGSAAGSGATAGTGSSGGSAGHGMPVTADQLAADQAAIDAADAEQAVAQQNIAAATLVSPIDGTVAQVGVTAGQNTSGASGQDHIVIIGPGSDQIMTAVSDSQVGQVKNGQQALITPDGSTLRLTGKVTAIGALGSTTSSGVASYPVTISLDSTPQQLFPGATAAVTITLATAHAAVAVPTSAVHAIGSRNVVTVLQGGSTRQVRVELGVVGPATTEVTSGLSAGDAVVLADLNAAIPTAGTNPGRGFGGGGGGGGAARRIGG